MVTSLKTVAANFKMATIAVLVSTLFGISSNAADKFQQLIDFAKSGEPLQKVDPVQGVWVGRCFYGARPNTPVASVLEITRTNSEGPLFRGLSIVERNSLEPSPEVFDHLSKENLLELLKDFRQLFNNATEDPVSVVLSNPETSDGPSSTFTFFKYLDYIIVKETADQDQVWRFGGKTLKLSKGEVWAACYYFAKK